jgi:5-formyltetrahydrofolate cyclo-ligase
MDSASLRKNTLAARDNIPQGYQDRWSHDIFTLLISHATVRQANHIFIYVHFRSEVQTLAIIKHLLRLGKNVSVPLTLPAQQQIIAVAITDPDSQLIPGYFDIPEPAPALVATASVNPATIDTVIVPGSVFDPTGGRLGYGGGFYDRFLARDAPQASRVALAYNLQLTQKVPVQPHDQCMDFILTEQQIYDCQRKCHAKNSNLPK